MKEFREKTANILAYIYGTGIAVALFVGAFSFLGYLAAINKLIEAQKAQDVACVVEFPDGSKFEFPGEISLRIVGVGVNAVITFVMAVALSGDIVYTAA